MKPLKEYELQQVAGGYNWGDFKADWKAFKQDAQDWWKAVDNGLAEGDRISTIWKNARDAVRKN
ncbi:hypothetical protein [Neisseria yangbaofengii]|uniref:hypothetical protein n=2 Tax=Neisseria yangbaofengii TaxID=2709396 RepID=UPI003BA1E941